VSVINRTAAERYWPGVDPIGRRFRLQQEWREIIGIVDDVGVSTQIQSAGPDRYNWRLLPNGKSRHANWG
jgi:hypothetical protein